MITPAIAGGTWIIAFEAVNRQSTSEITTSVSTVTIIGAATVMSARSAWNGMSDTEGAGDIKHRGPSTRGGSVVAATLLYSLSTCRGVGTSFGMDSHYLSTDLSLALTLRKRCPGEGPRRS